MKILVIGQSVVDRIFYKGIEEVKPGGIFYAVVALSNFTEQSDEIFLCSTISKKDENLFLDIYNRINKKYIGYADKIPQVSLTINDDKERDEKYNHISQNLSLPIEELNNYDGILINMITGFDITLDQMIKVRKEYDGLIYFDVHTFSRGVSDDMKRYFRRISDFHKWAENIDILQANEEEIKTISDKTVEIEIVKEMFSYGVKLFIVTKGEKGVRIYFRNNDEIESVFIPVVKVQPINKVGCGDVFGAIFFYNYIRTNDIIDSLRVANLAAGIATTYSQTADYKGLKSDVLQRYS